MADGSCFSRLKAVVCKLPFCICVVFFAYLLLGGLLFSHIEGDSDSRLRENNVRHIEALLHKAGLNDTLNGSTIRNLSESILRGAYPYRQYYSWDFFGGVHFCLSVVSTIGYGILAPTTQLGRLLCVFYACFGIPINIIFLSYVGQLFTFLIDCLFSVIICFIPCLGEEKSTRVGTGPKNHTDQSADKCCGSVSSVVKDKPNGSWVNSLTVVPRNSNGLITGNELTVINHSSLCMEMNSRNVVDTDFSESNPGSSCEDSIPAKSSKLDASTSDLDDSSTIDSCESNYTQNEDKLQTLEGQSNNLDEHRFKCRNAEDKLQTSGRHASIVNGHGCCCCRKEQQRALPNLEFRAHHLTNARQKAPLSFVMLCVMVSLSTTSALIHYFGSTHLSFIDAVYMQFITFTTIGFGDLVPTPENVLTPKNMSDAMWTLIDSTNILLGLAALSTTLSCLTQTDRVAKTKKWFWEKTRLFSGCKACRRTQGEPCMSLDHNCI